MPPLRLPRAPNWRTALRPLRLAPLLLGSLALSGCDLVVMKPSGFVAQQQANLIITATLLMLLIIVPVIFLTLYFAWRYRASNAAADYQPDWDHSTRLELLIWGAPLLIIIVLGSITWVSTHKLDPYRPLDRIDAKREVPADMKPLVVQVVALDWKWLFLYPEQGVASVNELAVPVDRPVQFRITASTVMNAFYVPEMAGMIYAMPAMETQLHGVLNKPGQFRGLSANYSGDGFSGMRFDVRSLPAADFDRWVEQARQGGQGKLTREAYLELEKPSHRVPVAHYAAVEQGLYSAILNRCVDGARMCASDMMAIDEQGGGGKGAVTGVTTRPAYTLYGTRNRQVVAALCTPEREPGLGRTDLLGLSSVPRSDVPGVDDAAAPGRASLRLDSVSVLP